MAWYNASWLYRFKITSDQTKIDEAIDNVFYDLANAPAAFWTHVNSDGGDIRVTQTDEVTEVAREVSDFSVGSTLGSLFFKATGLSASINTDYYVYYGNSGASEPAAGATFGKNNVWTSLLGVFHLDESASPVTDSKAGGSASAVNSGHTFDATGKLRTGVNFPNGSGGTGGYMDGGNQLGITTAALTVSMWVNPTNFSIQSVLVKKCHTATLLNGWNVQVRTDAAIRLGIANASVETNEVSAAGAITTGALQWIAVTYDGSNARFYVNGSLNAAPALTGTPTNAGDGLHIGGAGGFECWNGVIDELRVANTVRSQNWITTEYNNQNAPASFWSTAAEETAAVTTPLTWLPRQMILRGPRGLMTPSGPVPPVRPEP